ncbi:MAG: Zn-ribbon domain-containing OB-fold protein [Thermodesulfobacteriota bacterium]|nr:Zn-ribbon domain-containing OB-fold protein [Thermodesulfobacteriota bacterium]
MQTPTKPLPIPDEDTREFWEGCKRGELLIQRCNRCERYRFQPRAICPDCMSLENEWKKVSGKGKIYSFVVYHQPHHPAWKDEIPYVVALVELDEGIRMISNIIEFPHDQVKIGMAVEVKFEKAADEITLPKFKPVI